MSSQDSNVASMSKSEVKRRNLVKGAAWTVPVVAVAAAAPMAAASPIPARGLNGWVQLQRDCDARYQFVIDGVGNYPNRGLWVFTTQSDAPTSATITFWLPSPSFTFTNSSGTGWSNLARNSAIDSQSPATGYYAYTTTYTGNWNFVSGPDRYEAATDPRFLENDVPGTCGRISAYATRTVTYSPTDQVSFTRGPVTV